MTKQRILQYINAQYKAQQARNDHDFESRLEVALKDEKFKDLFEKQRSASLAKIKNSTAENLDAYKNASKALLQYIESNNIDLEKHYKCPVCKDTGFVDGKYCDCKKKLLVSLLKQNSYLPKFAKETFETLNFGKLDAKQSEKMTKIATLAKKWASDLDNATKAAFFISGEVGVGKTTIAFCAANEAINHGYSVYYTTAYDFTTMIIDKQFNRLQDEEKYVDMLNADLLIIDDLGSEHSNQLAIEQLFAIIDSRINENKKIMICTNVKEKAFIANYGERSFSRLASNTLAIAPSYIQGDDLRKIKC